MDFQARRSSPRARPGNLGDRAPGLSGLSGSGPGGETAISAQHNVIGIKTGASPNELVEVVVDQIGTFGFQGFVDAYETDSIAGAWEVDLEVLCARVAP
jgi:hypothetical protein